MKSNFGIKVKLSIIKMEMAKGNESHLDDYSLYESEENDHEKTYVTVHADSFNEQDFNNFLNCLDKIHESESKRKAYGKMIKNYCVQVPYIDNSILKDDDDDDEPGGHFDRTCDEMKQNISQMFSYFDEDVHLNYDDDFEVAKASKSRKDKKDRKPNPSESFRESFLRNRQKIKELQDVDTRPVIRGVIKKPNAPNTSLNKNQVDKIMNEFNRVKINYYSKDNYVEFTNIDYFYCDSDLESLRSEKVGKLKSKVLSKFEAAEANDIGRKSPLSGTEVVPKNSVRDKIDMFTKMDLKLDGTLQKSSTAPSIMTRSASIIKNTSAANKNQNKCYIKDINNSLRQTEEPLELLEKISSYAQLNDVELLMKLERVVNKFDMSLLHTLDGLMRDDAFALAGSRMLHLNVATCPSIERFNETFDGEKIDTTMENVELSVVEANEIQLQMQVNVANRATMQKERVDINVIFMAQYETDARMVPPPSSAGVVRNSFFVYFTSLFEVEIGKK